MSKFHVWIPEDYEFPSSADMLIYLTEMGVEFKASYNPARHGTMFVFEATGLPTLWATQLYADNLVTEVGVK